MRESRWRCAVSADVYSLPPDLPVPEDDGAAALEPLPHRQDVEPGDLLALDVAHLPVVIRDELHRAHNQASTSPAFASGGNTG